MFEGRFDRINDHHVIIGGLSFNTPTFNNEKWILHGTDNKIDLTTEQLNSFIIRDIGKKITADMGQDGRIPIIIKSNVGNDNIYHDISSNLKGKGVIDMWCKQEGSLDVVLSKDLLPLKEVLQPIIDFEIQTNKNYINWNMWLLIDTRKVFKGSTQRNAGFHYDGLNISGKHANDSNVSIYAWTNKIPTLFCKKPVKFPDNFQPDFNASIYAQRMIKEPTDIITFPNNSILKFDGTTVHSGCVVDKDINDRIFVRVCFTGPKFWFDRHGNTINPFLTYPPEWNWRIVHDPSVKLKNSTDFNSPEEFKNMWDTACLGHHAFSTMYSGKKSHEYQLIQAIRLKGTLFLNQVVQLYRQDRQDPLNWYRAKLLEIKYF